VAGAQAELADSIWEKTKSEEAFGLVRRLVAHGNGGEIRMVVMTSLLTGNYLYKQLDSNSNPDGTRLCRSSEAGYHKR
jgi:hypothetical protein